MKIIICKDVDEIGVEAARQAGSSINEAIKEKGNARLLLSTGASQFTTIEALTKEDVDWSKVDMFHLDEYIGISKDHKASFVKYLKERFVNHVNLKKAHFVSADGDVDKKIHELHEEIRKAPIDVALIGIGENGHIAFNDPPADFETKESYIKVELDDKCKLQQVGEGWFDAIDDVPNQAITMSVYQILNSKKIISCVPHKAKAKAIKDTIENEVTNLIPATILKTHEDWTLFLDEESSSLLDK